MKKMYKIESRIKKAFDRYRQNSILKELIVEIADVADYSVHSKGNASIMYNAIKDYCPLLNFECIYYDGENGGVYRLLDFDPNRLDKKALLERIKTHLVHYCHIDFDSLKKAMENVYLLNVNTLIKVKGESDEKS